MICSKENFYQLNGIPDKKRPTEKQSVLTIGYSFQQCFVTRQYGLEKISADNMTRGYELRTDVSISVIKKQTVIFITVTAPRFNQH